MAFRAKRFGANEIRRAPVYSFRRVSQVSQLDQMSHVDFADPIIMILELVVNDKHESLKGRRRKISGPAANRYGRAMIKQFARGTIEIVWTRRSLMQVYHTDVARSFKVSVLLSAVRRGSKMRLIIEVGERLQRRLHLIGIDQYVEISHDPGCTAFRNSCCEDCSAL